MSDSLFSAVNSAKFTSAHRLLREDGFNHVVHAENIADKYYKIFFLHNGKKHARLGIIASKRTIPGAAQRNRAKRTIREAFRRHSIKALQLDLVVLARRADTQAVHGKELEALFSRLENRCASL